MKSKGCLYSLVRHGVKGIVKIKHEYADGLKDIDGFSHIILLYHFHLSQGYFIRGYSFFG